MDLNTDNIFNGIDVNSIKEPEVADDPKLIEHIDDARNLLKNHNLINNTDPFQVIKYNEQIKVMFSESVVNIREIIQKVNLLADYNYVFGLNTQTLSNGNKPYNYDKCNTTLDIFKKMSDESNNHGCDIGVIEAELKEIEKNMINIRRLYELILNNSCDYI